MHPGVRCAATVPPGVAARQGFMTPPRLNLAAWTVAFASPCILWSPSREPVDPPRRRSRHMTAAAMTATGAANRAISGHTWHPVDDDRQCARLG